jgi:hypothetical protein
LKVQIHAELFAPSTGFKSDNHWIFSTDLSVKPFSEDHPFSSVYLEFDLDYVAPDAPYQHRGHSPHSRIISASPAANLLETSSSSLPTRRGFSA